ncbi:ribosome biogenesis GTPase A [Proteiniborus ethanoligenes]|uniref:Ribosome biogenesis GTPase A n=1 Tax=Proteiniborus ethanoligenes TaxID=415015 RepID=A0A1H3PMY5_9FIRM|nr:ribosome biogenesis GTPase YlqF [Proteiniborus ethanoligenes]SDZ02417.1 ribosome biogenesis GTPase A [Proteiniborus ethanoligenes]
MNINWYPGHMKKTKDLIINNLKLVDLVIELLDARIPYSSKNPNIDTIVSNKPRIVVMNKSDLSNEKGNYKWAEHYKSKDIPVILANATSNTGVGSIMEEANKAVIEKFRVREQKGIKNTSIRAMIVGIPNVGKSTLINSLAGRKGAQTGNRPGITKGKQWIKLKGNIELLDTPGILWPKFEDKDVALNLAFTGAIKDEIMDIETLALKLIEKLNNMDPVLLERRYEINVESNKPLEIMDKIAIKRGCILKNQEIDYTRVSHLILDEFRRGFIGRITLEYPEDIKIID